MFLVDYNVWPEPWSGDWHWEKVMHILTVYDLTQEWTQLTFQRWLTAVAESFLTWPSQAFIINTVISCIVHVLAGGGA